MFLTSLRSIRFRTNGFHRSRRPAVRSSTLPLLVEQLEGRCLLSGSAPSAVVVPPGVGSADSLLGNPVWRTSATVSQPGWWSQWQSWHTRFLAGTAVGNPDVLLLGDSITQGWTTLGAWAWQAQFRDVRTENFAIGGNGTGQVLDQLQDGEMVGLSPRLVVLMVGSNNLAFGRGAGEVAQAVGEVVSQVRADFPHAHVLLLGILPRGPAGSPLRGEITQVNAALARLESGSDVHFVDIGKAFVNPDGTIPATLMADRTHPTPAGYEVFASALAPTLRAMLGQTTAAAPGTFVRLLVTAPESAGPAAASLWSTVSAPIAPLSLASEAAAVADPASLDGLFSSADGAWEPQARGGVPADLLADVVNAALGVETLLNGSDAA